MIRGLCRTSSPSQFHHKPFRIAKRSLLDISTGGMARFLAIVLGVWAVMHLYAFWRLSTVPWVAAHIPRPALLLVAVAL